MSDEAQTIAMAFLGECRCGKGQCQTCLLAGEIRRRDTQLAAVTAERDALKSDIDNAVKCAHIYCPDYPWQEKKNLASEAVWACGSSYEGANKANNDLHVALKAATERAEKAEAEIVKARKYGALSVMGLLMKWAQKLGGTICLGLTIDETTGQPTGATLDVLHGDGEKYGALISLPDGEKIIPADVEARAVAHWAECEAWRTWNDRPSGERFEKVEDAREASDRARGVPAPAENPRG